MPLRRTVKLSALSGSMLVDDVSVLGLGNGEEDFGGNFGKINAVLIFLWKFKWQVFFFKIYT